MASACTSELVYVHECPVRQNFHTVQPEFTRHFVPRPPYLGSHVNCTWDVFQSVDRSVRTQHGGSFIARIDAETTGGFHQYA